MTAKHILYGVTGIFASLIVGAFIVSTLSGAQVSSTTPPTPTSFAGVTCSACAMNDGVTLLSPVTIDGIQINPVLTGTTGNIGGGLLSAGSCASGTATVTGARAGMTVIVTPNADPGSGVQYQGLVSANDTVLVRACALLLLTPVSTPYNVRVVQ